MNYAINLPGGSRDYLEQESRIFRRLQTGLADLFEHRGCSEVILPTLEYAETFQRSGTIPIEQMIKLIDRDGRILVLRPDLTTSIARVCSTKLKHAPQPQRLYYIQSVFQAGHRDSGRESELFQAGVELIGLQGIRADLEALALAISAVKVCGIRNFHIEIGHTGLFKALVDELTDDRSVAEEIRTLTEEKNFAALGDLLEPYRDNKAAHSLLKLLSLFGGEEVLQEARLLSNGPEADRCIDYLFALQEGLRLAGFQEYIRFDLSLVQRIHYYTGIVFVGFAEHVGQPILAGGRYDELTAAFGSRTPAIGFGLNISLLASSVKPAEDSTVRTLIHYTPEALFYALQYMEDRGAGTCELSPLESPEETLQLAAEKHIPVVVIIDSDGAVQTLRDERSVHA